MEDFSSEEEPLAEKKIPWQYPPTRRQCGIEDICRTIWTVLLLIASIALLSRGLWNSTLPSSHALLGAPTGSNVQQVTAYKFQYNATFSEPPSPDSDRAWKSLFPKGVGYIKDPNDASKEMGVSLFHQLHCIDILRHIYYDKDPSTSVVPRDSHHSSDMLRKHARHCIEYLRHSVLCAADSTLEPADANGEIGGAGVVHQCRNYEGLKSWAADHVPEAE